MLTVVQARVLEQINYFIQTKLFDRISFSCGKMAGQIDEKTLLKKSVKNESNEA